MCMDFVFYVWQVCEKYLANGTDVFWAFMGMEKAYDTIDRHALRQMLSPCIKVYSLSIDSSAHANVRMDVSGWFPFIVE